MRYVHRLAAVRRDNPNIPRVALAAVTVGDPFHVGRPRKIAAAHSAPLRPRNVDDPARFSRRKRQNVKAALFASHPKSELLPVRRDTHTGNVLISFPKKSGFERGQIQLVEPRAEIPIGGEIKLLAIFGPGKIRIVPRPIGQPARQIRIAAGHPFWLVDRNRPNVSSQAEREGFAVGRWFRLVDSGCEFFPATGSLLFIARHENRNLLRLLFAIFQQPKIRFVFEGNIGRFACDTRKPHRAPCERRQRPGIRVQVVEPEIGCAPRVVDDA